MADYSKRKNRRRNGRSFRYIPVTLLLFVAALIIGLSGFFRVSDIIVTGANIYSEDEIIDAAGIELGNNLVFFNASKVGARVRSKLPYTDSVSIVVKYPSTVEIQMTENVPIASIMNNGSYWIIDAKGKILEQTGLNGTTNTIVVTGMEITEPTVGKTVSSDNERKLTYLTELLQAMLNSNIQDKVTELDISSIASINFDYDDRFNIDYGDGSNGTEKLAKIIEVIDQLKPTDKGKIEVTGDGQIHFIPR